MTDRHCCTAHWYEHLSVSYDSDSMTCGSVKRAQTGVITESTGGLELPLAAALAAASLPVAVANPRQVLRLRQVDRSAG